MHLSARWIAAVTLAAELKLTLAQLQQPRRASPSRVAGAG